VEQKVALRSTLAEGLAEKISWQAGDSPMAQLQLRTFGSSDWIQEFANHPDAVLK
jgi:hypothetical protein